MPTILVIDDTPDNRTLLSFELEERGYEVVTASSGQEGLEQAFADPPDVILLDIMMPDISGIEVCRRLKADGRTRAVPVILVTAMGLDENVVAGLDAGADDYVSKPFNQEVLAARIRAALRVKESYDAMMELNRQLREEIEFRKQVEERLDKKEQQLRQAQKMEAVGALAGGIAHEFNNLLQAIRGYTSFAMDSLAPEEQARKDLEQALVAADRAAALTSQLLCFSRSEPMQKEHLQVNDVVRAVSKMIRPLVGEMVELETHLADDLPAVYADGGALQQVLMNLCINARDAMPDGGKLTIGTQRLMLAGADAEAYPDLEPGAYVCISVTDTGCGMTPEVRQRIFEPFFTTKEVGKGTGLGLAMVYGVVKDHGGVVNVYSEPGQGTTFKVYLPAEQEFADQLPPPATESLPRGTETILVGEDDPLVREVAVRVLHRAGYRTLEARDGEEVIEVFRGHADSIDLAILDVVLPKLGGHEVYGQLKQLRPDLPVIFCTGYDPRASQAGFVRQEGVPLIEKPCAAAPLLELVRETLDRHARPAVMPA